jgi:pyruvate dehydrogenase E1 component
MISLGTDGFGRSDTRANLRRFFEVDREAIATAALAAIHPEGAPAARAKFNAAASDSPPWAR